MLYARDFAINHVAPELVAYHADKLLGYWGDKALADVKGATCREYIEYRTAQIGRHGKPISIATARRELETLQAAINCWHKESPLATVPAVTLPSKGERRERHLSRQEAARALRAARQLRLPHISRFILTGIDNGSRHGAILSLQWLASTTGGHVDVDAGVIYRRGSGQRETKKKRPPVEMSVKLRSHMERWQRFDLARGISHVVNWQGKKIKKERRAWARVMKEAGLGEDVTPHVLRHTCATWALYGRDGKGARPPTKAKTIWEVAGIIAASAKLVEDCYGHHYRPVISGAYLGREGERKYATA